MFSAVSIDTYVILKFIGILIFTVMATRAGMRIGYPFRQIISIVILGNLAGYLGARAWYIVQHVFGRESYDTSGGLLVWHNAGTVLYGWLLAGSLAFFILTKIYKISFLIIYDAFVPWILVEQLLGRLGCFVAGCCYGKPLDAVWAVTNSITNQRLHPVQLYEVFYDLILFLFVISKKKSPPGQKTMIYVIGYPVGRFFLEFFRGDNLPTLFHLTVPQLASGGILLSLFFIWLMRPDHDRS